MNEVTKQALAAEIQAKLDELKRGDLFVEVVEWLDAQPVGPVPALEDKVDIITLRDPAGEFSYGAIANVGIMIFVTIGKYAGVSTITGSSLSTARGRAQNEYMRTAIGESMDCSNAIVSGDGASKVQSN